MTRGVISIYNEDCMEAMKSFADNAFDLAIVDPPYGLGSTNFVTSIQKKRGSIHKDKKWNNKIPSQEYFEELYRVSKNRVIWGCNYFMDQIKDVGRIIHYKDLTPYVKHGMNPSDCDLASQSFDRCIRFFHYRWCGNVQGNSINWKNEGLNRRIHPTQKPVQLYKWLLQNYAKPNDKILDTHLGSGSIAIACYDLGFDLTGYEIDSDYYKAAMLRLERHQSQGQLF